MKGVDHESLLGMEAPLGSKGLVLGQTEYTYLTPQGRIKLSGKLEQNQQGSCRLSMLIAQQVWMTEGLLAPSKSAL